VRVLKSIACWYAREQRIIEIARRRTIVGQPTAIQFGEKELSAVNARADALSKRDASAWEEAVEWVVPDCGTLCAAEWRMATAPDFD